MAMVYVLKWGCGAGFLERSESKNPDIERKLWGAIKKSEGFSAF